MSANADPKSIDFTRVRTEYGDREDFGRLCEQRRPLQEFIELTIARSYEQVLFLSRPWIAQCPIDIDARIVTAIALTELGKPEEAEPHYLWHRGLVESILASGDGKSPETAFRVISVDEEYSLLRALKLRRKSQALTEGDIDVLTVEGESGESTMYFDPAAHFRRLRRSPGAD